MVLYAIITFILYGWIEFEAMAHVVDAIGGLLAFIGIFVTAAIGIHLLRSQSAIVMAELRADIAKGQPKSPAIASSLSLLVGAVLMLIPGYVTDMLGFLCFMPGIRTIIGLAIAKRFQAGMKAKAASFQNGGFGAGFSPKGFSAFQDASSQDASSHETGSQEEAPTQKARKTTSLSDNDIIEGEFSEKN